MDLKAHSRGSEGIRHIGRRHLSRDLSLRLDVSGGDFHRRALRSNLSGAEPDDFVTEVPDPGGIVRNDRDRYTALPEVAHAVEAAALERQVSDGQRFVDDQNLWIDV